MPYSPFALDFTRLWLYLGLINRLFAIHLGAVCIYAVVRLAGISYELSRSKSDSRPLPDNFPTVILESLSGRLITLRNLHMFSSYLFAFCFATHLWPFFRILEDSKRSITTILLEHYQLTVAYAIYVLLILLLLYALIWYSSVRVNSFARRHQLRAS